MVGAGDPVKKCHFPRCGTGHQNPGGLMKEFVFDDDYKPLIPDAEYEVQCVEYNNQFCFGKAIKTFLKFKIITEGDHHGKKLFMAFNMPYNGRIKTGSKYYKSWCMVNDWRKPSRNAKMSPRHFLNKVYRVKTRIVKPPYNGKKEMPEQFWYSVVDEITEVIE